MNLQGRSLPPVRSSTITVRPVAAGRTRHPVTFALASLCTTHEVLSTACFVLSMASQRTACCRYRFVLSLMPRTSNSER